MARVFEVPKVDYVRIYEVLQPYKLRRRMMVGYKGRVGRLLEVLPDNYVTVQLYDEYGIPTFEIIVHPSELKQAKLKQIPESRRPINEDAVKLGYI